VSQDVQTGHQIATQEMPLALANPPQRIDALILDCSLQGTAELAYDVRASARVYVGSEESPPGTGYPYDVWLNSLKSAAVGPCDAGRNLISDTVSAYPDAPDITQSVTDLSRMDAVAGAVNAFFIQGVVRTVSTLYVVGRYERFDTTRERAVDLFDLGLTWVPSPALRIKADYEFADHSDDRSPPGFRFSFSVLF